MLTLVGSAAVAHWTPLRTPNDIDYICTLTDFQQWYEQNKQNVEYTFPISSNKYIAKIKNGLMHEFEIAHKDTSALDFINRPHTVIDGVAIPSMDWLFTLKTSHRYLKNSPHFEKTVADWHWMRDRGCVITDEQWLKRREEETYNYSHPKLKQSKQTFFSKDSVKYIYDHDCIHEAVKIGERPAYTYYAVTNEEVLSSKKKFFALPEQVRINGVLEESYVLALERSQIPYRGQITPFESFKIALSKVCTSITSGWFRQYAFENYFTVLGKYSEDYLTKFDEALAAGRILPFTKESAYAEST